MDTRAKNEDLPQAVAPEATVPAREGSTELLVVLKTVFQNLLKSAKHFKRTKTWNSNVIWK